MLTLPTPACSGGHEWGGSSPHPLSQMALTGPGSHSGHEASLKATPWHPRPGRCQMHQTLSPSPRAYHSSLCWDHLGTPWPLKVCSPVPVGVPSLDLTVSAAEGGRSRGPAAMKAPCDLRHTTAFSGHLRPFYAQEAPQMLSESLWNLTHHFLAFSREP